MNVETAKDLLKLVNDPWVIKDLEIYMNSRVQTLYKRLEQAETIDEVRKLQGAIEEVKRIRNLQNEVRAKADEK